MQHRTIHFSALLHLRLRQKAGETPNLVLAIRLNYQVVIRRGSGRFTCRNAHVHIVHDVLGDVEMLQLETVPCFRWLSLR